MSSVLPLSQASDTGLQDRYKSPRRATSFIISTAVIWYTILFRQNRTDRPSGYRVSTRSACFFAASWGRRDRARQEAIQADHLKRAPGGGVMPQADWLAASRADRL